MIESQFINDKNSREFDATMFMEIIIAWMILFTIITIFLIFSISKLGILMMISYALIFITIPIYECISSKIRPFVRTKKALELSAKLNGLKNYLSDFTLIKDRKIKEIKMFNEYILYAIVFDIKGELDKESKNLYSKILKTYRY